MLRRCLRAVLWALGIVGIAVAVLIANFPGAYIKGYSAVVLEALAYPTWALLGNGRLAWFSEGRGWWLFLCNAGLWGLVFSVLSGRGDREVDRRRVLVITVVGLGLLASYTLLVGRVRASQEAYAWKALYAKASVFEGGAPEDEVVATLGPYTRRYDVQDKSTGEDSYQLVYDLDREFFGDGWIAVKMQAGRFVGLDAVPGFPIRFDSQDWAVSSPERRGFMAEDLITRRLLIGRSKGEVIETLGEACENPFQPGNGMAYFLGSYADDLFRDLWLIAYFGGDDEVRIVHTVAD